MQILPISQSLDILSIRNVLASPKITYAEKVKFINNNIVHIQKSLETVHITGKEFKLMMHNRPLIRFRFLKNSFTKRGDKKILAKTLDVAPTDIDGYIDEVCESILESGETFKNADETEAIKTYVYRHGKKDQVVAFLDYELSHTKDILQTLYKTLEYNTDGMADYFSRPVHRMSNKTMVKLYNVIDHQLRNAVENGTVEQINADATAKWALVKIYEIQNNSKVLKALKTYRELNNR